MAGRLTKTASTIADGHSDRFPSLGASVAVGICVGEDVSDAVANSARGIRVDVEANRDGEATAEASPVSGVGVQADARLGVIDSVRIDVGVSVAVGATARVEGGVCVAVGATVGAEGGVRVAVGFGIGPRSNTPKSVRLSQAVTPLGKGSND